MSIVDELLAMPGCYTGRGWFAPDERPPRVARLVVTILPGASGVACDYEVLSMDGEVKHREHSMLARGAGGDTYLLVAHASDDKTILLHEVEAGLFAERQEGPFHEGQMAIRIEVREPGVIRHAYCWADERGSFAEVDVAEMRAG